MEFIETAGERIQRHHGPIYIRVPGMMSHYDVRITKVEASHLAERLRDGMFIEWKNISEHGELFIRIPT